MSLFPIRLSSSKAYNLICQDPKAKQIRENVSLHAEAEFYFDGVVTEDGVCRLSIHANTDNGFIQTSGQIYSSERIFTKSEVEACINEEIRRRAIDEIEMEDLLALKARVSAREAQLRKKLCP